MQREHIAQCSFNRWYNAFADVTTEREYLLADGISIGDQDNELYQQVLHILGEPVSEGIASLRGSVFPKLNWSSPKDASWIAVGQSLRCSTLEDILLLLKSSDFVTHDLTEAFLYCDGPDVANPHQKYFLVLRRWTDIPEWTEFRCFVKNKKIAGISQRHHCTFFENVLERKESIKTSILEFFTERIANYFPLQDYTFDVFLQDSDTPEHPWTVRLLDFNPSGIVTDPLLFKWEELNSLSESAETCMRCVTEPCMGGQPTSHCFGVPADVHLLGISDMGALVAAASEAAEHLDNMSLG